MLYLDQLMNLVLIIIINFSASTSTADGGKVHHLLYHHRLLLPFIPAKGMWLESLRALHWLITSNILYGDIHIEDGNITCDDSDNNK